MTGHLKPLQSAEDSKRYIALVLAFFLIAYLFPLGFRDLLVPDETRYAEIPREMITTSDWGIPHLDGLRYFEKPPLGYWMHAGSLLVFGENNFAVRLPSAVAIGLTAPVATRLRVSWQPWFFYHVWKWRQLATWPPWTASSPCY